MPDSENHASLQEEFRLLMERVKTGCPTAARELYDRYSGHIRRVVRHKMHHALRTRFDSIDFLQDVWASFFVKPWEKYTFDSPDALVGFLAEMAYNKVAEAHRLRFHTKKQNLHAELPLEGDGAHEDPIDPPGRGPTPSQVAIANEHWERLLDGQPEQQRLALELLRQGHSYKETAKRTGLNLKCIQRLLQKLSKRQDLQ